MPRPERGADDAWSFLRAPDEVANELLRQSTSVEASPVAAAREESLHEGVDLDSVLSADEERMKQMPYPTAQCLTPAEVESYVTGEPGLPRAREGHLTTCSFCQRVTEAAQPSAEQLKVFLTHLRQTFGRAPVDESQAAVASAQVAATAAAAASAATASLSARLLT